MKHDDRRALRFFAAACLLALPFHSVAQQAFDAVEIIPYHVSGSVHMLLGAGGNMAVSIGKDGVLLVDTQFAPLTDKVLAAIRALTDEPIRFVVNTHIHGDHIGGNENVSRIGAAIFAHENVKARMTAAESAEGAIPVVTFDNEISFHFNGEEISVIPSRARAHTDGDSFVYFRGSNVLHTGDVYVTLSFPVADTGNGGSILGHIEALNQIMELSQTAAGFLSGFGNAPGAYPDRPVGALGRPHNRTDTLIIPGHGRLADEIDVLYFRNMVAIIRDRVAIWAERGMSLEEILALRPAFGWEARYGADTGPRTTTRFIETLYAELTAN